MKLVDLSLTEFAQVLGSDAPAPGGGSAAALSAANGISLTKMVCELTLGKKKYAEFEAEIAQVHAESARLQESLLAAIDKDTEAFNLVSALKEATKSPYGMMEDILTALQTTQKAVGKSNTNAASDLGVAALNLKAGLQGAWLNVLINLSGVKDEAFVADYRNKGEDLLQKGCALADEIYQEILKVV